MVELINEILVVTVFQGLHMHQIKLVSYEMQTLYDTCQKFDNIEYLNEWFVTSIIHDGKNIHGSYCH